MHRIRLSTVPDPASFQPFNPCSLALRRDSPNDIQTCHTDIVRAFITTTEVRANDERLVSHSDFVPEAGEAVSPTATLFLRSSKVKWARKQSRLIHLARRRLAVEKVTIKQYDEQVVGLVDNGAKIGLKASIISQPTLHVFLVGLMMVAVDCNGAIVLGRLELECWLNTKVRSSAALCSYRIRWKPRKTSSKSEQSRRRSMLATLTKKTKSPRTNTKNSSKLPQTVRIIGTAIRAKHREKLDKVSITRYMLCDDLRLLSISREVSVDDHGQHARDERDANAEKRGNDQLEPLGVDDGAESVLDAENELDEVADAVVDAVDAVDDGAFANGHVVAASPLLVPTNGLCKIGPRSNLCLRTNSGLGHPDAVESHRILQDGRELESSKNALCMFVSELACRISFPVLTPIPCVNEPTDAKLAVVALELEQVQEELREAILAKLG
ncbi:hypothetical protein HBI04_224660 [Parastagonospora nodorum]|nr:hypothetical protein HBI04_224660 [Parastagonospora nodorum]